jgi:ferredoxin, 2Fe-2S
VEDGRAGGVVQVTLVLADGTSRTVEAEEGWNLMEVAVNESVPGIYGDCGGEAQCATCHVRVDPEWQASTGERGDMEKAMLHNAYDVTDASRLACQIVLSEQLDGLSVQVVDD